MREIQVLLGFATSVVGVEGLEPPTLSFLECQFSSPTKLGVPSASSSGSTSGVFVLPPGINAGKHRAVLSGTDTDESEAIFSAVKSEWTRS